MDEDFIKQKAIFIKNKLKKDKQIKRQINLLDRIYPKLIGIGTMNDYGRLTLINPCVEIINYKQEEINIPKQDYYGYISIKNKTLYINNFEREVCFLHKRFLLAHMIGHIILHQNNEGRHEIKSNLMKDTQNREEIEANIFAKELIMWSENYTDDKILYAINWDVAPLFAYELKTLYRDGLLNLKI